MCFAVGSVCGVARVGRVEVAGSPTFGLYVFNLGEGLYVRDVLEIEGNYPIQRSEGYSNRLLPFIHPVHDDSTWHHPLHKHQILLL